MKKEVAVKKVSKTNKKNSSKKPMVQAEGMFCFWVNNGPVICNFRELHGAMKEMSDDQFMHHVTDEKNDFAAWVDEVLGEGAAAREIRRAKTRMAALMAIEKFLKR